MAVITRDDEHQRQADRVGDEMTLASDHRVCDGHLGGLLLAAIDRHLQEPEKL